MKIKTSSVSKRSLVYEAQAHYLAKTIRRLETDFKRQFRPTNDLSLEDFERFSGLDSYQNFIDATIICGFVCHDYNNFFPLNKVHLHPNDVLKSIPFQKLRHYIHTLQRAERWNSEYSTFIYDSVKSGALSIVASRLESDTSLYESQ